MESQLRPFLFEGDHLVRTIERDGVPWFIALDVCKPIGLRDISDAVEKLDLDEKGRALIPTLGGEQDVLVVSESGLYTIVLRSRDATKPGTVAHRFRKWITAEVLPTLRRSGSYQMPPPGRSPEDIEDDELQTADSVKLRKINTCCRVFGERAGAQMWIKLGMETVPAMKPVLAQMDFLETETVTTVTKTVNSGGNTH